MRKLKFSSSRDYLVERKQQSRCKIKHQKKHSRPLEWRLWERNLSENKKFDGTWNRVKNFRHAHELFFSRDAVHFFFHFISDSMSPIPCWLRIFRFFWTRNNAYRYWILFLCNGLKVTAAASKSTFAKQSLNNFNEMLMKFNFSQTTQHSHEPTRRRSVSRRLSRFLENTKDVFCWYFYCIVGTSSCYPFSTFLYNARIWATQKVESLVHVEKLVE